MDEHVLLTPLEMSAVDHAAGEQGLPVELLMRRAGWCVARAIRRRFPPVRTLVLCGPGNNGGDGVVAASVLRRMGWPVAVAFLDRPPVAWTGRVAPFAQGSLSGAGLVVDAVFGAGLSRDVDPRVSDVLAAARCPIVAIDVPSGLDGATGQPRGSVRAAALTVTFVRRKPGHLLMPGRILCGETVLADIGVPDRIIAAVGARSFRNAPGLWWLPEPASDGHKYTRGHVTVLGGPAMTGAARLVSHAARRAGAGLVTLAATGGADVYRTGELGTIVSDRPLPELLADERRRTWVCGPGLGGAAGDLLAMLLPAGRDVVVDADALTACAGAPERLRGAAVLTPHAGEFARVFGPVGPDKLAAVREASRRSGAVVILKGADTVIADPDGRAAINDSAPPWLATAGAGDVLAGIVAGLLAQGMPRWEAACAAVWLHGRAGMRAGANLIAEDLEPALQGAIADARVGGALWPRQPEVPS